MTGAYTPLYRQSHSKVTLTTSAADTRKLTITDVVVVPVGLCYVFLIQSGEPCKGCLWLLRGDIWVFWNLWLSV